MEGATGNGGVFFKARDPQALAKWYRQLLAVPGEEDQTYAELQSTGPGEMTVWSAFPLDTEYLGGESATHMINYRVRDLDAMLAQFSGAGVEVDEPIEEYDSGRFAWAADPEGNRFELWESPPAGP